MNVAWLFPGQGSQFVGMGGDYLKAHPSVAQRFAEASDCLGIDLRRVLARGPRSMLMQTDVAQVAIYTLSVAIAELLAARDIQPVAVAGHSLGQFSALTVAGAVTFQQCLSLVADRGRFMHEQNQSVHGSMFVASGLAPEAVEAAIGGIEQVWVANYNAPDQTVLAGSRPALQAAHAKLLAAGGKLTWIDVAGPYHTALLEIAAQRFALSVRKAPLRDSALPLVANSDAAMLTRAEDLRVELQRHMLAPVRWSQSMQQIAALDVQFLIEVGAGKVLRGLALRNVPHIRCLGTDTVRDLEQACAALAEVRACVSS